MYYYFALWRDDGTTEPIHDLLRRQAREMRRRREDPTAVVLDSQTVRASVNAPKDTAGLDPGKKSPGRKRGIATDVLGLIIAVVVVAASVHDNDRDSVPTTCATPASRSGWPPESTRRSARAEQGRASRSSSATTPSSWPKHGTMPTG